jgi:predicted  nucleic acid-binding Zn-ribbon protein
MDINKFLSDDFVKFSNQIKKIHEKKKKKKEELKKLYDEFQAEIVKLDEEAKALAEEWELKFSENDSIEKE